MAGCGSPSHVTSGGAPSLGSARSTAVPPGGDPAALSATPAPNRASEPAGAGRRSGVSGGALFGGDRPLAEHQRQLGRNLAIFRTYYRLGQPFPKVVDARVMASGTTLLVSLDVHGTQTYASIAGGEHDARITAFLLAMEKAAIKYRLGAIYLSFEHEADNPAHHGGLGNPAEFVQAWDHLHRLAASLRVNWYQGGRLHWVFILTHNAYSNGRADFFWPGSDEADIVAADGYNTGGCWGATPGAASAVRALSPPVSPAALFDPLVRFAQSHGGLPVFIAEWGSVAYHSPDLRPAFIQSMQAYISANPEIAAALYWAGNVTPCDFTISNSPSTMAALAAMGRSAAMQGRVTRSR